MKYQTCKKNNVEKPALTHINTLDPRYKPRAGPVEIVLCWCSETPTFVAERRGLFLLAYIYMGRESRRVFFSFPSNVSPLYFTIHHDQRRATVARALTTAVF